MSMCSRPAPGNPRCPKQSLPCPPRPPQTSFLGPVRVTTPARLPAAPPLSPRCCPAWCGRSARLDCAALRRPSPLPGWCSRPQTLSPFCNAFPCCYYLWVELIIAEFEGTSKSPPRNPRNSKREQEKHHSADMPCRFIYFLLFI